MKIGKIYVVLLIGSFSFKTYSQVIYNINGSENIYKEMPTERWLTQPRLIIKNNMNSLSSNSAVFYNGSAPNPESGVLILSGLADSAAPPTGTEAVPISLYKIEASGDSVTKIKNSYSYGILNRTETSEKNIIIYDLEIKDNSQLILDGRFIVSDYSSGTLFRINSSSSKKTIITQYFEPNMLSGEYTGILYKLENTADAEIILKDQTWLYLSNFYNSSEPNSFSLIDTTASTGVITTTAFDNFLSGWGNDGSFSFVSFVDAYAAYRGGSSKDIYTQDGGTAAGVFLMGDGDDEFHAKSGGLSVKLDMGAGDDKVSLHGNVDLIGLYYYGNMGSSYPMLLDRDLSGKALKAWEIAWTNKINGGDGYDQIDLISRKQNIFTDTSGVETINKFNGKTLGLDDQEYAVSEFFEGQINLRALNLLNFENLNILSGSNAYLVGDLDLGGSNGQAYVDNTSSLGLQRVAVLDGMDQALTRKINGNLVNAGVVDIASDKIEKFNTLEVLSYQGKGGIINLDTVLDDGSTGSDKLIINAGTGSGNSKISIRQKGGLGAETVGKGIQVIKAFNGATTTNDAFTLYQPVSAGAYSYHLYRDVDNSWYLSTNIDPPTTPEDPKDPKDPEDPEDPEDPDYSDEPFTVSVFPLLAQYYGAATLSSWRERMGGLAYADPKRIRITNNAPAPLWVRLGTQHGKHHGGSNIKPTADSQAFTPRFNYESNFLQLGLDIYRGYSEDHTRTSAGLFVTTGSIHGNVRAFHELNGVLGYTQSTATLDNIALGGYWTKIAHDGSYVDLVSQYIQHDLITQSSGDKLTASGNSFMASVEAGKTYAVSNNWTLVPQGQLRWQNVRFGNKKALASQTEVGSYSFPNNQALQARVGLEMRYQSQVQRGFWMRLDTLHEFKGDSKVRYTPKAADYKTPEFVNSRKGSSLELLAGADLQINENFSFFTSVGYRHGLSSMNKGNAWNANVALRWGF